MQTINLDLSVRSIIPLLHAKQGDVGRKFKAILTDGGAAYPVPAGAAVSVWYSGASGEGNYTDIGADSAVSVSGNEITVELITQMLANYGEGKLCLAINTADGDQIGTWNIPYMVEPLPGMGSAAAQAYFTAFSQAVQNLPYPDPTLSVTGRAADAGAVGTALAGKAPNGLVSYTISVANEAELEAELTPILHLYRGGTTVGVYVASATVDFLGGNALFGFLTVYSNLYATFEMSTVSSSVVKKYRKVMYESWKPMEDVSSSAFAPAGYGLGVQQPENIGSADNALANGGYIVNDPRGSGTGWLLCSSYSETYKRHDFYNVGTLGDTHLVRWMKNGAWEEWDWDNPPMIPGVVYRTTERYNGYAVYAVAFETALGVGTTSINILPASAPAIVRSTVQISGGEHSFASPAINGNPEITHSYYIRSSTLYINAFEDSEVRSATALIYFVRP